MLLCLGMVSIYLGPSTRTAINQCVKKDVTKKAVINDFLRALAWQMFGGLPKLNVKGLDMEYS